MAVVFGDGIFAGVCPGDYDDGMSALAEQAGEVPGSYGPAGARGFIVLVEEQDAHAGAR
jgi:hypothetical protein